MRKLDAVLDLSWVTDPQAAWVAYRKMRSIFAYHANYLVDYKLGVIVDAEGHRANRIDENRSALAMVDRVAKRFGLNPSASSPTPLTAMPGH